MKIYTSYFAKTKELETKNIQPISIALYTPDWFLNPIMIKLQPPRSILFEMKNSLNSKEDNQNYSIKYIEQVLKIQTPESVYKTIEEWSGGKDVALCCFEKSGDFCHRHLVSMWLNKYLSIGVVEYSFK